MTSVGLRPAVRDWAVTGLSASEVMSLLLINTTQPSALALLGYRAYSGAASCAWLTRMGPRPTASAPSVRGARLGGPAVRTELSARRWCHSCKKIPPNPTHMPYSGKVRTMRPRAALGCCAWVRNPSQLQERSAARSRSYCARLVRAVTGLSASANGVAAADEYQPTEQSALILE